MVGDPPGHVKQQPRFLQPTGPRICWRCARAGHPARPPA